MGVRLGGAAGGALRVGEVLGIDDRKTQRPTPMPAGAIGWI